MIFFLRILTSYSGFYITYGCLLYMNNYQIFNIFFAVRLAWFSMWSTRRIKIFTLVYRLTIFCHVLKGRVYFSVFTFHKFLSAYIAAGLSWVSPATIYSYYFSFILIIWGKEISWSCGEKHRLYIKKKNTKRFIFFLFSEDFHYFELP